MGEHQHSESEECFYYCSCGVKLCLTMSPDKKYGCLLEEGHTGPHRNYAAQRSWPNRILARK